MAEQDSNPGSQASGATCLTTTLTAASLVSRGGRLLPVLSSLARQQLGVGARQPGFGVRGAWMLTLTLWRPSCEFLRQTFHIPEPQFSDL